ncbi:hypothetical protein V8C44DRAFT_328451 [Trichoderma aethiopicum]
MMTRTMMVVLSGSGVPTLLILEVCFLLRFHLGGQAYDGCCLGKCTEHRFKTQRPCVYGIQIPFPPFNYPRKPRDLSLNCTVVKMACHDTRKDADERARARMRYAIVNTTAPFSVPSPGAVLFIYATLCVYAVVLQGRKKQV